MSKATTTKKTTSKKAPKKKPAPNSKCKACKKFKAKCDCGRKLFNGKDEAVVVSKLKVAFSVGATDVEACASAEISVSALYRYQESNPEFREEKDVLKEKPAIDARLTVVGVMTESEEIRIPDGEEEYTVGKGKDKVKKTRPKYKLVSRITPRALRTAKWYLERKKKAEFAAQVNGIFDDGRGGGVLTEERKAEIAGALQNWSEEDSDYDDD